MKIGGVPVGTILPWAGPSDTIPKGYMLCDGMLLDVTRKTRALFKAIGNQWGGDGKTNFRLPDLRGLFLRGVSGSSGRDPDAEKRVALSEDQRGPATEPGSVQEDAIQAHKHSLPAEQRVPCVPYASGERGPSGLLSTGGADSQMSEPIASDGGVVNIASETRPKNASVHWIIRSS